MVLTHLGNQIWYTNTIGERPTGIPVNAQVMEVPTRRTFQYDGTVWNAPESFIQEQIWTIYKQGLNYKAKNGFLGYSPTGAISTSLNTVWNYIATNFEDGAEPDLNTGGRIVFGKGIFTFTAAPAWAAIDNTWAGSFGIHMNGQGMYATAVKFAPGSAVNSGFHWEGISHGSLKDVWIDVNNNITNAIKVDATNRDTANVTFRDLYITNTNNPPGSSEPLAGQKGFYLVNTDAGDHTHFFNLFDNIYFRNIAHCIDTTGCLGANNTFYTIRNIKMWVADQGITLQAGDGRAMQTQIYNIYHQCGASSVAWPNGIGSYTIKFEDATTGPGTRAAIYNIVDGVTVDVMTKTGAYVLILGRGVRQSRFANITNSGTINRLVLDKSGSWNNQFVNCLDFVDSRQTASLNINSGDYSTNPATGITGDGLLACVITHEISDAQAGITIDNFSSANGKSMALTTGATLSGVQSSIRSNKWITARQYGPKVRIRWHNSNIGTQRFFAGLTESAVAPPISDTYTAGQSIAAVCQPTAAHTTYQLIYNDTTGAANITPFLKEDGTEITIDTAVHVLWMFMDAIENTLWASIDNNPPITVTVDIPGTNDKLNFFAAVQNTTNSNRTLNLYNVYMETQK